MSTTRWIFRGLLVLILLLMLGVIYQALRRRHPDFYWDRAQAALASGSPSVARIHLLRMVKDFPNDSRGHRGLAAEYVKEAKLPENADGYAQHPAALSELAEAGRLSAGDLELQKLLLSAFLRAGRVPQAAAAGALVAKAEPENPDALFARAWQAADAKENETALKLLDQLPENQQQEFRTLGLRAQVLSQKDAKDSRLPAALDAITIRAGQLTAEQLAQLGEAEFGIMARLLPASVFVAEDVATAQRRAGDAISVCEKLVGAHPDRSRAAAQIAAQVSAVLSEKFNALATVPEQVAARQQLAQRLDKLLVQNAVAEKADWLVAEQAAQLAFDKGEYAAAVTLLDKALAAHKADRKAKPEQAQAMHLLAARALLGLRRHQDAKVHLASLVEDKRTSGIAQLMLGAVALDEGRQQDALTHFNRAERDMGANHLVRIALAQTLVNLNRWNEALPYLGLMHDLLKVDNPEVQAWLKQMKLTDARIHLEEARALLALKRQPEAEAHFAALAGTELEPRGIELRVDALLIAGQKEKADSLLAGGLARFPQDASLISKRVALLQQMGQDEQAMTLLSTAAAKVPDDLQLQLMLAQAQARVKKYDEALALLTALEQKTPQSLPIQIVRADVLIQAGRTHEANLLAEKIHSAPTAAAAGSFIGAVAALRAHDPQKAAASLKGETADNLQLRCLEGLTAAATGDYATAIAALGESIRVTSLRGQAGPLLCYSVAKLAEKEGPAAAGRALAAVVAASPDEPFVLIAQADVLTMEGKFDAALAMLDRLELLEKDSPVGAHFRAAVFSRTNQPQAALKECQRALAKDPHYVPSLILQAQLQFSTRAYAAAIASADAALAQSPTAWQMAVLKSEAQLAAGQQPQAVATIQQLIERQPELIEGPRQLVSLQMRAGQYEAALATCRQAREKYKDDLGLAIQETVLAHLAHQGDPGDALAKKVVGTPPDAGKALALADAFGAVKDFAHAQQWGDVALAAATSQQATAVHLFLGNLGLAQNAATPDRKQLELARDHFTAVLQNAPNHFVAGNNLAWLLAVDLDQPQQAVPIVERVRGETPPGRLPLSFVDTIATVYRRAGQPKKALPLLEEALAAHPDQAALKFHLGMTLGQIGLSRAADAKRLLKDSLTAGLSPDYSAQAKQELQRIAAAEEEAAGKAKIEAADKEAKAIAAIEAREAAKKGAAAKDSKSGAEQKSGK